MRFLFYYFLVVLFQQAVSQNGLPEVDHGFYTHKIDSVRTIYYDNEGSPTGTNRTFVLNYDERQNLISSNNGFRYEYDEKNRLTEAFDGFFTTKYLYNSEDQIVARSKFYNDDIRNSLRVSYSEGLLTKTSYTNYERTPTQYEVVHSTYDSSNRVIETTYESSEGIPSTKLTGKTRYVYFDDGLSTINYKYEGDSAFKPTKREDEYYHPHSNERF